MSKALNLVLNSLIRREHSAWELRKKLEQKGYDSSDIEHALAESQRMGYQSDERYSEQVCRARIAQGYGPLRIQKELEAKGVVDELIDNVLTVEPAQSWLVRAIAVAEKKYQAFAELSWDDQQKLKRFLFYRGFPLTIIASVFEKVER